MADWTPKWGPELDHIFIPSFGSLLGPRFGIQIWTQSGSAIGNFAAAAEVLQADLRRTSMSVRVNTCVLIHAFSLCASHFVSCIVEVSSWRHVSTSFLDPVLEAMMKQVCWHSRRSKAYRGLPEARMAASRLLSMCWSSRGLPRLLLAPFTALSESEKMPIEEIHALAQGQHQKTVTNCICKPKQHS